MAAVFFFFLCIAGCDDQDTSSTDYKIKRLQDQVDDQQQQITDLKEARGDAE